MFIDNQRTVVFDITTIAGKGKGLVASCDIPKGTRITCERPLFTAGSMSPDQLERFLAAKLKAMPKDSQRQFLSLHNNFPGRNSFSGTFKTNALPCGSGSPIGGIYPTICLINHSCMPNAHNNWNGVEEHETIHAIRDIEKGAEITISYNDGGNFSERQAFLQRSFGFTCTCGHCNLPSSSLQASDARRTQIQQLDQAVGDPLRMMSKPQESLRDCYSLLQFITEEYGDSAGPLVARLHYDAFQISIAHGDQARGSIFAERAYKVRVICEGEDSPETQRLKSFAMSPSIHGSFGAYSSKWKTTRESAPEGLGTGESDRWLFRQEK